MSDFPKEAVEAAAMAYRVVPPYSGKHAKIEAALSAALPYLSLDCLLDAYEDRIAAVRVDEREACAKVADKRGALDIAVAIRARKDKAA